MHTHICTRSQPICKQIRENNDWVLKITTCGFAVERKAWLLCGYCDEWWIYYRGVLLCCTVFFLFFLCNPAMRASQQYKLTHIHVLLLYLKRLTLTHLWLSLKVPNCSAWAIQKKNTCYYLSVNPITYKWYWYAFGEQSVNTMCSAFHHRCIVSISHVSRSWSDWEYCKMCSFQASKEEKQKRCQMYKKRVSD